MQPVMSVTDVREFEAALAEKGLKPQELMRRAGAVVALQAARLVDGGSVVVLCGMGNNGGDGWVAADNLARHGYEVNVVAAATPAVMKSEQLRRVASRVAEMGIPVYVNPSYEELIALLAAADVVVDAVFGTGFSGVMPSPYDMWVQAVDDGFEGSLVSVDIPSGISATTGMSEGAYFEADVTVTMFAVKPGLISGRGREASGSVVVASLATDDEGLADLSDAAAAFTLADKDYYDVLPAVDPLQDKYTRGRVLVVAGSTRFPGAAVMAAQAAARSGAGYVTLAVPEPVVPIAQAHLLSVPVVGLPSDAEGAFGAEAADRMGALAEKADVVLAGPGMTTAFGACECVRQLLSSKAALVLDADALNAVVKICTGSAEEHPAPLRREYPLVLTPHRRELARLVGVEPAVTASLAGAMHGAQSLAWSVGSADFCVVAKGPVSAVSTIDSTLIPQPGPAALATAGTGDVLSGVVAGLLAQAVAQLESDDQMGSSDLLLLAAAADRVHALAGYLAQERHGSRGVVAPDVAALVGVAIDALLEAAEQAHEEGGEDAGSRLEGDLAFEDESRIAPPPEVARLVRADAAARNAALPGELQAYEGELEEPEPVAAPVPATADADEVQDPEPPATVSTLAGDPAVTQVMAPVAVGAQDFSEERTNEENPIASGSTGAVPPFLTGASAVPPTAEVVAEPEQDEDAGESTVFEAAPQPIIAEGVAALDDPEVEVEVEAEPEEDSEAEVELEDDEGLEPEPEVDEGEPEPEPEAPQSARLPVPPFLAKAVEAVTSSNSGASPSDTMGFIAVEAASQEEEDHWEPTPEELERRRLEAFHERATLHIDAESVTPVDERPSAKPRRKR